MADPVRMIGIEPSMWFVVFKRSSKFWWVSLLATGRFKHVAAFGWLGDLRMWVFYDVGLFRTRIAVLPASPAAEAEIAMFEEDAEVVAFTPRGDRVRWWRPGFWCVPAIAHLVGLRGAPMRPDALHRAILRQGGSVCGAKEPAEGEVAPV